MAELTTSPLEQGDFDTVMLNQLNVLVESTNSCTCRVLKRAGDRGVASLKQATSQPGCLVLWTNWSWWFKQVSALKQFYMEWGVTHPCGDFLTLLMLWVQPRANHQSRSLAHCV